MLLLARLPGVSVSNPTKRLRSALDEISAQDGVDGRRPLEESLHPAHAVEQRTREADIAEQMIVQEVEMASGQARDLGERVVHALRVEPSTAGEEGVLVAEVAMLRAPAGHDNGVRHQVAAARDQVAPHRRQAIQRASRRGLVAVPRVAGAKLREKRRKRLLRRAEKNRVGVCRGFVGQGRDVQAAHRHERAPRPIVVGDAVGPIGIGDVGLDHHEIRPVVEGERLDMFVHENRLFVWREKRRERGEAERWKQRVLDRTPIGAGRFGQGGKNQLDSEMSHTL